MRYSTLLYKKAFSPFLTIAGAVTLFIGLFADAVFGNEKPIQELAIFSLAIILLIMLYRLLIAPYQVWEDDQQKLNQLNDPLLFSKKNLSAAVSSLLSASKEIYETWRVSDEVQRVYLLSRYSKKRERASRLADTLLVDDNIYRAAQDTINSCDILMNDSVDGAANRDKYSQAHNHTKKLHALLLPNGAG